MTDRPRPYILAETTWTDVRETLFEVAVLPWGATEPHNLHLPYATDVVETGRLAAEAARRAWQAGAAVVVLPAIPYGANAQQADLRGTVNMDPSTQLSVLRDIVDSLEAQAIPKLLVLNGHGGNDFRPLIREIQARTDVFLCLVDWFRMPTDGIFDEPGDHAGELETSLMMHLAPELVRPLEEAGPGAEHPFRIHALREPWAWAPRQWRLATDDTGVGDPSAATADKGAAFFEACAGRLAAFLEELADADLDDLYVAE